MSTVAFSCFLPKNSSSSWVNSNSTIFDCSWYWFFCPEICCKLMCHCGKLKEAAQKEDCQQQHLNWSSLFQKCIFEPYQLYMVHNRGSLKRQTVILGRYSLSFFHNVHGKYTINRTGFKYSRFFKSTVQFKWVYGLSEWPHQKADWKAVITESED